jgi:hypothetical protein
MMLERVGGQLGVSKDDLGRFEGPQIVHYDPGGEYRWHHDAYEEGTEEGDRAVADQGQRCQVGRTRLPRGALTKRTRTPS